MTKTGIWMIAVKLSLSRFFYVLLFQQRYKPPRGKDEKLTNMLTSFRAIFLPRSDIYYVTPCRIKNKIVYR